MRLALLLWSLLVLSGTAAAAFDPNEIPKDGPSYRLSVCARSFPDSGLGVPAHALLILNTVDPAQKRVFHAVGTVKGVQPRALIGHAALLSPIPDALATKDYASLMQNCLVLTVTRAEYQAADRMVAGQLANMALTVPKADVYGIYGLAPDDCVAMIVKVLKSVQKKGLVVPNRPPAEPAIGFVRRLIDQNLQHPA